ncbi:MAG TPA: hypothetical protein VGV07_21245 [Devosia sp.]|uniref:hypothetical protein n=1 Tax=Devosia sp. TaxID=1871048 RepID=UPI002DDCE6C1|nr:hypothetical protein [Devosia sp.]HEV2517792.1 hypothetical protein [Devosia sp.]
MKRVLVALAALGLMAGGAQAAAPSEAQKADFYKTCMGIAQDDALCSCKADAAMTLIDSEFMAMVIASMKGKSPPEGQYSAYNTYVAKSNQICKPNY